MNLPPGASPLAATLCLNCANNGIPDQIAAARFRGIGVTPILRWVPLCRPCLQIFHGFTQLIEQGEPLTDAECAQFLGVPPSDFQVSGDDDDGKEAQGAAPETTRIPPQTSVEPPESPGLFPESKTAAKALEGSSPPKKHGNLGGTRTPRMTLPEDADPTHYIRCLLHPERGWLLRGSWQSHILNAHAGTHAHQVPSEPKLDFVCPDENRDGCYASFSTPRGFKRHITEGHGWVNRSVAETPADAGRTRAAPR